MPRPLFAALILPCASPLRAEVVTEAVEYSAEGVTYSGVLVYDNATKAKRPGVVLVHDQGAASADARSRAGFMAKLGYAVLSVDVYGKGTKLPIDAKDRPAKAGLTAKDRTSTRARMTAAHKVLIEKPIVDARRVAAVGYGVGGTCALELARAGVDLEGCAIIHGDLASTSPTDYKAFQPNILIVMGDADPLFSPEKMKAFDAEAKKAEIDAYFIILPGVAGDFTNLLAGKDPKSGRAYSAEADRKAHEQIGKMLAIEVPVKVAAPAKPPNANAEAVKNVPEKAFKMLKYVDAEGEAPEGFEGGRTFLNVERLLAQTDKSGRRIRYREWDVNPLRPGVNRGAERLVTGSDGAAYYTDDHYKSFKKVR